MALRCLRPDDPQSRCPTNTCLRIKFCSYRICPRVSARTNSWRFSHSEYHIFYVSTLFSRVDVMIGTPTCTKSVLLQTKRILRSSSTWTKGAQLLRRTHYTITNSM